MGFEKAQQFRMTGLFQQFGDAARVVLEIDYETASAVPGNFCAENGQ